MTSAADDRLLIGTALAQLSDQHRAVIRRSYYKGWTTAQIADDLHIADGAVKSRLHHAMQALRFAFAADGGLTRRRNRRHRLLCARCLRRRLADSERQSAVNEDG